MIAKHVGFRNRSDRGVHQDSVISVTSLESAVTKSWIVTIVNIRMSATIQERSPIRGPIISADAVHRSCARPTGMQHAWYNTVNQSIYGQLALI